MLQIFFNGKSWRFGAAKPGGPKEDQFEGVGDAIEECRKRNKEMGIDIYADEEEYPELEEAVRRVKGEEQQPKTEKSKSLLKLNTSKDVLEFLNEPTVKIAEALTGILVSGPKEWTLSAGKIVQAGLKGRLLEQLGKEIDKYRQDGRIKEDFLETEKNRLSLHELLKFIDEEVPDEERFNAMKSLFFSSVAMKSSPEDEALAYELMQICKLLNSGEIVVLKAVYDVAKTGNVNLNGAKLNTQKADEWLNIVAHKVGHKLPSLINVHEKKLMDLGILTARRYVDDCGVISGPNFRLTDLGYMLAEYITKYKPADCEV